MGDFYIHTDSSKSYQNQTSRAGQLSDHFRWYFSDCIFASSPFVIVPHSLLFKELDESGGDEKGILSRRSCRGDPVEEILSRRSCRGDPDEEILTRRS